VTAPRATVLVTGGNSGIGFECARRLAAEGWHVLIASRNREASAAAVRRIVDESGAGSAAELGVDLGSIASVRALAREIAARDVPLAALVCNAGLQVSGDLKRSTDGYELTFAANHLGHFLLTNLLLARLAGNRPARIVVVASGVHDPKLRTGMPKAAVADVETLATTGGPRAGEFNGRLAYVNSKLCNLWFTYELVRRIDSAGLSTRERPLAVLAFEPGLVPGSGLARDYPPALRFVWNRILPGLARVLSPMVAGINPAPKAGAALARMVLDPALAQASGKYYPSHTRWREAASSDASYDVDRARDLWEGSVRMTHLASGESPLLGR
jgi:NAD(P)-dependent dehydrogenase (short-subunit alcohol dehydrogenase family)